MDCLDEQPEKPPITSIFDDLKMDFKLARKERRLKAELAKKHKDRQKRRYTRVV